MATTSFPEPSQPIGVVVAYFADNAGAVRVLSTFHAFAATALLVFTAYAATVIRRPDTARLQSGGLESGGLESGGLESGGLESGGLESGGLESGGLESGGLESGGLESGVVASGGLASVALASGSVAAGFLLLDAALFWALASPALTGDPPGGDPPVVGALHVLSYLCGGVVFALPLGVFIACVSAVALGRGLLPRWLGWLGVAAAIEAGLYGTTLLGARGAWSPSGVLVVAALLPLLWVGAVSLVLVRAVSRR